MMQHASPQEQSMPPSSPPWLLPQKQPMMPPPPPPRNENIFFLQKQHFLEERQKHKQYLKTQISLVQSMFPNCPAYMQSPLHAKMKNFHSQLHQMEKLQDLDALIQLKREQKYAWAEKRQLKRAQRQEQPLTLKQQQEILLFDMCMS